MICCYRTGELHWWEIYSRKAFHAGSLGLVYATWKHVLPSSWLKASASFWKTPACAGIHAKLCNKSRTIPLRLVSQNHSSWKASSLKRMVPLCTYRAMVLIIVINIMTLIILIIISSFLISLLQDARIKKNPTHCFLIYLQRWLIIRWCAEASSVN